MVKVDALAAQALCWVEPVRFHLALSTADRDAAYRLRYQAVIGKGWMRPEDLPAGLERDEYDDRATHVLARDGEAVVATARLVFPEAGRRLPTEAAFDLRIEPRGRVVDAGRFVVARQYSSLEHRLLATLVAAIWLEVRKRGYSLVCAAFASTAMMRVYARMGLRMEVLAPPRRYWGEERYPVRFDAAASTSALLERWLEDSPQA